MSDIYTLPGEVRIVDDRLECFISSVTTNNLEPKVVTAIIVLIFSQSAFEAVVLLWKSYLS